MTNLRNIQSLKAQYDLRLIVEATLGRARSRGKSWLFQCPFHNEAHGASLAVSQDYFHCFSPKCGAKGDIFNWLMLREGLTFAEALERLGGTPAKARSVRPSVQRPVQSQAPRAPSPVKADYAQAPSEAWQAAAWKLVWQARQTLMSETGDRARAWLESRGIEAREMRNALLGYLPGKPSEWHEFQAGDVSVKVPSGIVVPWAIDGELWGVKVRLAAGDIKYIQAAGGNLAGALYRAGKFHERDWGGIAPGLPIFFFEGEFDCLLAESIVSYRACCVTLGSASGRLNLRWMPLLWSAPVIYILTDSDESGEKAAEYLTSTLPRAKRVRIPEPHKDLTDFWKADAKAASAFLRQLVTEAEKLMGIGA